MTKIIKNQSTILSKNVIMGNVITRSAQTLSLMEKRILMTGIAKLGGKNEEIKITAEEFAEAFDIDVSNAYREMKKSVDSLMNRRLTFQVKDGKKIGKLTTIWVQGYNYFATEGYIKFKFSEYIFPFLFELTHDFTKYQLKQASALRSIHSWRLLELFESVRQSKIIQKDQQGRIEKTKKNEHGWLKISIEEFWHTMEVPDSYKSNFGDLRKRIIEPAIKELEQKDGWKIEYRAIKKGRKVVMLEFEFYRNPQGRLF